MDLAVAAEGTLANQKRGGPTSRTGCRL